jgi:TRAP-type C4-dicarboxylate transport system permease large subunit
MVLTILIGLMTPPIGMVLFVVSRIAGMPYLSAFVACIPFLIPILAVIALVIAAPAVALFLPSWLMR